MQWVQGTINKHIVQDADGEYVATFKDENEAAAMVRLHNIVEPMKVALENKLLYGNELGSEPLGLLGGGAVAASNGWTNHLPGVQK